MSTNTTTNVLSKVFDGFAFGWYSTGNVTNTTIDVNSIIVSGTATPTTTPPTINTEPVPVSVATNGSCAFSVSATGIGVTYQWHRNGTNLLNGGNISGSTSSLLAISPAGPADALSGDNGYYVTVTGIGNLSTNSTTNSLTLRPATNLIWTAAAGGTWDLNSTASWKDTNNNQTVFNYGDSVTFNDTAGTRVVNLTGSYLSAASVTVDTAIAYTFQSSGSFAGPGSLMVKGSGQLTINNANTYSGGTIISNATALLLLKNIGGLGSGPVTFAKAGATMEIVPVGSGSSGINGDIIVADDCTNQFDGTGAYAGVFLGNLSGTAGKTLTLIPDPGNTVTNERIRVYGANTTYNAKLVLGSSVITLAPYNSSGSQTYNGVISGDGAIIEKGTITYLNGANTYGGGTFPVSGIIGLGIDSVGNPVTSGPIGTNALFLTVDSTTTTTGSGMILASGGARTVGNLIQYPSGTNNLTLIIGGTNALILSGAITLNGNDYATVTGTYSNRIFQVTNAGLTTISGVISDHGLAYGFIKTGEGILALTVTETYTGPTTVSNGTLRVSGQLNVASAVTVATNGILGGTGTVNGPVTVLQGGAIAPGAASIGTLNLAGNLTLGGNVKVRVNRSGFACDEVNVTGTPSFSGTGYVIVTNTGAALQVGDTFHVFNKAVTGGVNLKVGGDGVGWTNKLGDNGTIVVTTLGLPSITNTVSGSTLTLSWPADYPWEVQSNIVGLAFSTNWYTVPNSGSSTSYAVTLDPARTNVFYRLVFP
jgi:autotransporter-associated beta strand protein